MRGVAELQHWAQGGRLAAAMRINIGQPQSDVRQYDCPFARH